MWPSCLQSASCVWATALHVDSDVTSRTADDGMEVTITLHYLDEAPGEAETEPPITEVQTTMRAKEE